MHGEGFAILRIGHRDLVSGRWQWATTRQARIREYSAWAGLVGRTARLVVRAILWLSQIPIVQIIDLHGRRRRERLDHIAGRRRE